MVMLPALTLTVPAFPDAAVLARMPVPREVTSPGDIERLPVTEISMLPAFPVLPWNAPLNTRPPLAIVMSADWTFTAPALPDESVLDETSPPLAITRLPVADTSTVPALPRLLVFEKIPVVAELASPSIVMLPPITFIAP